MEKKTINNKKDKRKVIYSEEFQAMLDRLQEEDDQEEEEEDDDEKGEISRSKRNISIRRRRRLTVEQAKTLEECFKADNRLEPSRKMEIAVQIGIDPRRVAIWFQNRRANCKSKQLELEFNHLRAKYTQLQCDCDSLDRELRDLTAKIEEQKAMAKEDNKSGEEIAAATAAAAGSTLREELRADDSRSRELNCNNWETNVTIFDNLC